jgi:4-hydroxymandelate oxidase
MPVGVAPTARHGMAHPDGEVATATAAARAGIVFALSSLATRPMEDLAAVPGPRWYQLYCYEDKVVTGDLVARAEAAGFGAIVLTVDLTVVGRREREVRGGYVWAETGLYGNLASYEVEADATVGLRAFHLTWDDVAWLRGATRLPLVLKGVMTGEDARLACEHGFDAVWVSNHGGRQLDRSPASIDVLEEVVEAVAGRAEVYLDGGVRRGTDVLTALALGARAVFAGRPWVYALAAGGEEGVLEAIGVLRAELETAMALLGTPTVADVTRAHAV